MNGDDLKRFRERRGLSRADLATILNDALGRRYNSETVGRWERGDEGKPVPKAVSAMVENLSLSGLSDLADGFAGGAGGLEPGDAPVGADGFSSGDTAPGGGGPQPGSEPQLTMLSGSSLYGRACEDLFEMVATGIGLVGAGIGSQALMGDGAIIAADKEALGQAYGRLAETNETFKRMLVGMTEGGVWLQVAMVTGTTFSKCWQSHAQIAAQAAADRHYDLDGIVSEQDVAAA